MMTNAPLSENEQGNAWLLRRFKSLYKSVIRLLDDPDHPCAVWLTNCGKSLDRWVEVRDWQSQRTKGGIVDWMLPRLVGYSLTGLLAFLFLLAYLVLGPTLKPRGWQGMGGVALAIALVLLGYWLIGRLSPSAISSSRWLSWCTPLAIQATAVLVIWVWIYAWPVGPTLFMTWKEPLGSESNPHEVLGQWNGLPHEAGPGLYPHSLIWWVALLFVVAVLARFLARFLIAKHEALAPKLLLLLKRADLFDPPDPPRISVGSILRSMVVAPLYQPIHLLYGPALWVLLTGSRQWDRLFSCEALLKFDVHRYTAFWLIFAVWWILLGFAGASPRLGALWTVLNRLLFRGGLFAVSSVVVLLAVAQVLDFQYVSTVIEGASWLVLTYLLAAYLIFWVFEYWVNRAICMQLLRLLNPGGALPQGFVPYDVSTNCLRTKVAPASRTIQLHGAARFAVVACIPEQDQTPTDKLYQPSLAANQRADLREVWNFYEKMDLFDAILDRQPFESPSPETAEVEGGQTPSVIAHPTQDDLTIRTQLTDLRQAVESYFMFLNAALVITIAIIGFYAYNWPRRPVLIVQELKDDSQHVDLLERLVADDGSTGSQQAVLVAGSGGGTRAALYTTSVLEGLDRMGALDDVELVSGCSGGGAALAYFASFRDELINPDEDQRWERFYHCFRQPFITEVVNGTLEARMAYGTPLGELLAESFGRRFYPHQEGEKPVDPKEYATLQQARPAIILNTTLCGQFTTSKATGGGKSATMPADDWDRRHNGRLASSASAGGRLIFTNLKQAQAFPQESQGLPPDAPNERLPYVVIQDPNVPLLRAAALGANFPPVFPNAAVDAPDVRRRYWVTDGGAMDNRGLISLLYSLRDALKREATKSADQRRRLKEIHIVVAEASAGTDDYQHDRGFQAAIGSKALLANGLIRELWDDVRQLHQLLQGKKLELHYLAMPTVFRFRGGLGTHWMLPSSVSLTEPSIFDETTAPREVLTQDEVVSLIRELHQVTPTSSPTERGAVCNVRRWAKNDPYATHEANWIRLQTSLLRKR